ERPRLAGCDCCPGMMICDFAHPTAPAARTVEARAKERENFIVRNASAGRHLSNLKARRTRAQLLEIAGFIGANAHRIPESECCRVSEKKVIDSCQKDEQIERVFRGAT